MKSSGRRGFLLVIGGIAFIALGAFVAWRLFQNVLTPPLPPTPQPVLTEKVLVTTRGIPLGAVLVPADLKVVEIPVELVPLNRVSNRNDVVGKVVTIPMVAGEMVLPHHLVDPSNVVDRTLAFSLEDDQVLMAFPVVDLMSRLNILKKGDLVDVFVSRQHAAQPGVLAADEEEKTQLYTYIAMQRITITAIVMDVIEQRQPAPTPQVEPEAVLTPGPQPTPTPQPPPVPHRLESNPIALMLALDPQDALILKHLKDSGAIFDIVLRSPTSTELFDTVPVTSGYLVERYLLQIR